MHDKRKYKNCLSNIGILMQVLSKTTTSSVQKNPAFFEKTAMGESQNFTGNKIGIFISIMLI